MKYKLYQQSVIGTYATDDRIKVLTEPSSGIDKILHDGMSKVFGNLKMTFEDTIDTPEGTPKENLENKLLEHIFMKFNMDDRPTGAYATSLMVGDVILLGDKYYRCQSIGFSQVEAEAINSKEVAS